MNESLRKDSVGLVSSTHKTERIYEGFNVLKKEESDLASTTMDMEK